MLPLLRDEASEWVTGFELLRQIVVDALTSDQGGMVWVNRPSGHPVELIRYNPGVLTFDSEVNTGERIYRRFGSLIPARDVIHLLPPLGRSPLTLALEAIGIAAALDRQHRQCRALRRRSDRDRIPGMELLMADDGGLSSFQRRMRAVPQAARLAVRPALLREAGRIVATMKALAPVDEGDLKNSLAVTGPNSMTPPYSQPGGAMVVPELTAVITAGNADVRYAHLVEFGTRARMLASARQAGFHPGTVAQPFFWPGFRVHRKKSVAAIKRAIGKAIREAK